MNGSSAITSIRWNKDWEEAKLHVDCYVSNEGDYYSALHVHLHRKAGSISPRTGSRTLYDMGEVAEGEARISVSEKNDAVR